METLQLRFLTNKTTVRWLTILNVLERNRSCTAQQISELTQLSNRTIIKEMRDIRDYFGDSIELITNNSGYVFEERLYSKYSDMKRQLVNEDPLFIILKSILEGETMSVEDWAFMFHLSESTMKRYLLSVIPTLSDYELQLSLTPVDLVGEEANIRKFFKDFYYEVNLTPHTLLPFQDMQEFIEELEEARIKLKTDISLSDFRYFLYIMIQRSKAGKKMNDLDLQFDWTKEELGFLEFLRRMIFKLYNFKINDSELTVLYIYCMSKRRITDVESEVVYCERFSKGDSGKQISNLFIDAYDEQLYSHQTKVTLFVEAFFISIKWLDSIASIMNKELTSTISFAKRLYPKEYDRTLKFLKENQKLIGVSSKYLEDISASLTLLVESIRDMYLRPPRKIAFLIEGSYFMSQLIQAKAFRYLSGYHQIFFPTIGDLKSVYLQENQIDLFVTNQEEYLTEIIAGIDYVLFKAIPDRADWNQLLKAINPTINRDFSIGESIRFE